MPIATTEPTDGELAAGDAECHAPAMTSGPLTLEESGKISQLLRPHGPSVNRYAHERTLPRDRRAQGGAIPAHLGRVGVPRQFPSLTTTTDFMLSGSSSLVRAASTSSSANRAVTKASRSTLPVAASEIAVGQVST